MDKVQNPGQARPGRPGPRIPRGNDRAGRSEKSESTGRPSPWSAGRRPGRPRPPRDQVPARSSRPIGLARRGQKTTGRGETTRPGARLLQQVSRTGTGRPRGDRPASRLARRDREGAVGPERRDPGPRRPLEQTANGPKQGLGPETAGRASPSLVPVPGRRGDRPRVPSLPGR